MKFFILITGFFLSFMPSADAQVKDTAFSLLTSVRGNIQQFTVDNLGNIYIITSTDQLKKIDARGDSIAVYNNVKKYGKLSSIDVSNPLKILLYYKDFATIVILDRFLNTRHTIDLRKQDIFQVSAISQSYDGQIWLFDVLSNKLKKISEEGKLKFETPDFRLLFDNTPQPQSIFDQDGLVYLYDSTRGFYVFDYYGTLKNKIPLLNWRYVSVSGKMIYAILANKILRYHVNDFGQQEYTLPPYFMPFQNLRLAGNKIYLHTPGIIKVYNLPD